MSHERRDVKRLIGVYEMTRGDCVGPWPGLCGVLRALWC
jgi:hypothetical protein